VLTRRFFVYTREQRSLSPAAAAFIAFLFDWVGAAGVPAAGVPAATDTAMRCGDASDAAERPR